jgi:hypothetical protein
MHRLHAPCPSLPACGARGRCPARLEPQARGLDPRGREGEVGRAAVPNPGLPDPLRPQGRRGGYSGSVRLDRVIHLVLHWPLFSNGLPAESWTRVGLLISLFVPGSASNSSSHAFITARAFLLRFGRTLRTSPQCGHRAISPESGSPLRAIATFASAIAESKPAANSRSNNASGSSPINFARWILIRGQPMSSASRRSEYFSSPSRQLRR